MKPTKKSNNKAVNLYHEATKHKSWLTQDAEREANKSPIIMARDASVPTGKNYVLKALP